MNFPATKEHNPKVSVSGSKKVWIDLDNSPHVPFFRPIIRELERRGYSALITARDRFQVCELADRLNISYKSIGKHYGKNKVVKAFWLGMRALQLICVVPKERPRLAVGHGSRSQVMAAQFLRIPSVGIFDYEHTKGIPLINKPTYAIVPELVAQELNKNGNNRFLLGYPGIKEDVYIPYFKPDSEIINELGLVGDRLIITVRPPATEAHYFRAESGQLFEAAMEFLCKLPNVHVVLLPRSESQKDFVSGKWASFISDRKVIIPKHAVDGLNLIWHSDLVISGGGTMNREAAALGVPVYSTYRGKIGAVDRYLSEKGRLVMIENADQLHSKIVLARRKRSFKPFSSENLALRTIISHIVNIIENQ